MKTFKVMKSVVKNFFFWLCLVLDPNRLSLSTYYLNHFILDWKLISFWLLSFMRINDLFFFEWIVWESESCFDSKIFFACKFRFNNLISLFISILMRVFHGDFTHVYFFLLMNFFKHCWIQTLPPIVSYFYI